MIANIISAEPISPDARLVESVLNGDRDAFAELVGKYQNPIAAFAYSACGDIAQSEDLAQETFIIAWRKLRDLKEPTKFKSWLFGIARNLINNSARKQTRNPLTGSDQLDENLTGTAVATDPTEHAISKEEEAILWQALEHIDEVYRVPLILFYREHQSIQRVADALDLSEETVRQRLSRGRKLLHERVVAFVEGALQQTTPDQHFTAGVMVALPQAAATSVALTGTTAKTATSIGLKAFLVPFLWLVGMIVGTWAMVVKLPNSARERKYAAKAAAIFLFYNIVWAAFWIALQNYGDWRHHHKALTLTLNISMVPYLFGMGAMFYFNYRTQRRIRIEESGMTTDPGVLGTGKPFEWRSRIELLGIPLVHVRFNLEFADKTAAKGWIALGTRAYGILFASGGLAIAPVAFGGLAIGLAGLGGFGVGVLAFGGVALGYAAVGGAAIGYMAWGGMALAWLAASGGAPIAHHFAMGGSGLAAHVNDDVAREFFEQSFFFRHVPGFFAVMVTVSWLSPLLTVWFKKRFGKNKPA